MLLFCFLSRIMDSERLLQLKQQFMLPTEVAIPKKHLPALHEAIMDYLGIEDDEFVAPPRREGTQAILAQEAPNLTHGIDEWYVDLKQYKFSTDDVFWLGSFWRDHINSGE
jgi:hypothetical protein